MTVYSGSLTPVPSEVLFVHPYRNGNARAARLPFDYHCICGGYRLDDCRPVFTLARAPGRAERYVHLLVVVLQLAEQAQRRG